MNRFRFVPAVLAALALSIGTASLSYAQEKAAEPVQQKAADQVEEVEEAPPSPDQQAMNKIYATIVEGKFDDAQQQIAAMEARQDTLAEPIKQQIPAAKNMLKAIKDKQKGAK